MTELDLIFSISSAILGLLLGSFANVVIHRLPLGQSVVLPRSECTACKKKIVWSDNIPIISFLLLKGKCRSCSTPISFRYPSVEALMGLAFWGCYSKFGLSFQCAEFMVLCFGLIVVSFIDLKHMILPDVFTLPGIAIGFAFSFLSPQRDWIESLLGILIGGGFLWLLAYLYVVIKKHEGMGGGDIKLLAWIGAALGAKALPLTVLFASVVGSVVGLIAASRSREGLKTAIPFGPFLSLGAIVYLFGGATITEWYFSLLFPMD